LSAVASVGSLLFQKSTTKASRSSSGRARKARLSSEVMVYQTLEMKSRLFGSSCFSSRADAQEARRRAIPTESAASLFRGFMTDP
jgi:hypothetical protein